MIRPAYAIRDIALCFSVPTEVCRYYGSPNPGSWIPQPASDWVRCDRRRRPTSKLDHSTEHRAAWLPQHKNLLEFLSQAIDFSPLLSFDYIQSHQFNISIVAATQHRTLSTEDRSWHASSQLISPAVDLKLEPISYCGTFSAALSGSASRSNAAAGSLLTVVWSRHRTWDVSGYDFDTFVDR